MAPRNLESSDWQVQYPEVKMRSAHLRRSREWADCSFRFDSDPGVGDSTLEAHRLILAMASPVFAAMFYGNVGDKEGPINISDIDQQIFSSLLDYIYTDEVNINRTEVAINLFRAANKYILVHLEKRCINYLLENLTPQNVCHVYEFSCLFNEDVLKHKCLEMFSTQTLDVIKGCSFKEAQVETVRIIYSLESLDIESELDLFNALVEYTESRETTDDRSTGVESELNKEASEMNAGVPSADVTMNDKCTSTEELSASDSSTTDIAKKRNTEARKIIPGLIEQIRFLTLAAGEFAANNILSSLLTEAEIFALLMNISSERTTTPMPDGFSTSTIPRTQIKKDCTDVKIPITLTNVSEIKPSSDYIFRSKIVHAHNVPWRVYIYRQMMKTASGDDKDIFKVTVHCLFNEILPRTVSWTCHIDIKINIMCIVSDEKDTSKILKIKLNRDKTIDSGYMPWAIVTNPLLGYVKDDTLVLEVHLIPECVQIMVRVGNTARKTVSIVMEQIRFLTLTPTEFAECKNLSHLLSDAEILVLSMNISSSKTNFPLPAGLSTLRVPRNKTPCKKNSTWTERITIKNISKLKKYESRVFCVGDIPWAVEVKPHFKKTNSRLMEKRLLVDIICLLNLSHKYKKSISTWKLNTQVGIRIIPFAINIINIDLTTRTSFMDITRDEDGMQWSFSWKMLTDPVCGVVRDDDSLILEVFVAQDQLVISKEEIQEKREDEENFDIAIPIATSIKKTY